MADNVQAAPALACCEEGQEEVFGTPLSSPMAGREPQGQGPTSASQDGSDKAIMLAAVKNVWKKCLNTNDEQDMAVALEGLLDEAVATFKKLNWRNVQQLKTEVNERLHRQNGAAIIEVTRKKQVELGIEQLEKKAELMEFPKDAWTFVEEILTVQLLCGPEPDTGSVASTGAPPSLHSLHIFPSRVSSADVFTPSGEPVPHPWTPAGPRQACASLPTPPANRRQETEVGSDVTPSSQPWLARLDTLPKTLQPPYGQEPVQKSSPPHYQGHTESMSWPMRHLRPQAAQGQQGREQRQRSASEASVVPQRTFYGVRLAFLTRRTIDPIMRSEPPKNAIPTPKSASGTPKPKVARSPPNCSMQGEGGPTPAPEELQDTQQPTKNNVPCAAVDIVSLDAGSCHRGAIQSTKHLPPLASPEKSI